MDKRVGERGQFQSGWYGGGMGGCGGGGGGEGEGGVHV